MTCKIHRTNPKLMRNRTKYESQNCHIKRDLTAPPRRRPIYVYYYMLQASDIRYIPYIRNMQI